VQPAGLSRFIAPRPASNGADMTAHILERAKPIPDVSARERFGRSFIKSEGHGRHKFTVMTGRVVARLDPCSE
jgi:hypothetical protein